MQYKILTGLDFNTDFLTRIMDLDREVYSDEYVGVLENMVARYEKNRDSFVCIMDETCDKLAGYINFFPCTKELYQDIRYDTSVIRDDDISPDEVAPYNKKENYLFVLSIAIYPEYRDSDAVVALTNAWFAHLKSKMKQGYRIINISAIAVSDDGKKFLRRNFFKEKRELSDGNTVFVLEKSYRSDIYLMLPLADNEKNHKLDGSFDISEDTEDFVRTFMDEVDDYLNYEMSNEVLRELKTEYLGEFIFLHTVDDYPKKGEKREEIVIGEEKAYAFLMSHHQSHLHVLTLLLCDSPFSTTQVQDQLSYGYLKIRNPQDISIPNSDDEDESIYIDIYKYIKYKYGLLKCGDGKTLLCMSKKPDDPREFENIMSGEAYNSMKIPYHIQSPEIKELCQINHAQYDYYEVYLSDVVIAFILKVFSDDVNERIELTATYAFIAQLVMFQNTSLAKTNIKITNALANNSKISNEQILNLYYEFGKTVRFWEIHNFKYKGTQAEAACITKAFSNEELRKTYYEHQEFLERIVELETARTDDFNGKILNIVATFLAVVQIQDFVVEGLMGFYSRLGIEVDYAQKTFASVAISVTLTVLLVYMIRRKMKRKMYRRYMVNKHRDSEDKKEK